MKNKLPYAFVGLLLSASPLAAESDCVRAINSLKVSIQEQPQQILELVSKNVGAMPNCSCEIVKASIQAANADAELVAQIVEAAVLAAPDQMRMVTQCAIALAPDAIHAIMAVVAKLDPNAGTSYSAKSSKSGKEVASEEEVASMGNPLDFPGAGDPNNMVGPTNGLAGGGLPSGFPQTMVFYPTFVPTFFTGNFPVDPQLETPVQP